MSLTLINNCSFADDKIIEFDTLRAQLANEKDKNSPLYIKNKQKLDKLILKNKINYSEIARFSDVTRLINEQKYSAAIFELNELIELGFQTSKCSEFLGDISQKTQNSSKIIAKYYKNAIQNDKDNVEAIYKLSKLYLKEKKNILAIENLKLVIEKTDDCAILEEIKNIVSNKIEPQNKYEANNLYETLGDTYKKLGEKEKSYEAYVKALMINPRDIYLKYYLSGLFYEDDLNNDAIKLFNSILNENPKDYQIKSARAKLLAKNGEIENAYKEYLEILDNKPKSIQAKYGIYKIYQNKLSFEEILKKINYKKQNYSPNIKDYREFSNFLASLEDIQGAQDVQNYIAKLEQIEQEKIKENQKKEEAKKLALAQQETKTKKVELKKESPKKRKEKKEKTTKKQEKVEKKIVQPEQKKPVIIKDKKYNELKSNAEKYLSIIPKTAQNLIAAANTYKQMGEFSNALKYYEEAKKLEPTNSDIYYNLGLTQFELNDNDSAKMNLTKAINLDNQNLKAKNLLAFVNQKDVTSIINKAYDLYNKKEYISSFEVLENGIKEHTQNAQLYYYRALVYEAMNRNAASIIDLQKAIELDAGHYMAYYQLGKVYEKIKDERSALVAYEKFLSIEPDEKELIDEIQKKVILLGAKYY